MLPQALVGVFILLTLIGLILKEFYERHQFEHKMDIIPLTPLIILGRYAFYSFYVEMGIFGTLLFFNQVGAPLFQALLIHPPLESLIVVIGMVLIAIGLTVAFWNLNQIEGEKLALTGPYRYVRHPIYLGCSMIAIGFFLSVLNLAAMAPLLIIPAQARAADAEEEILVKRYGREYIDYQRRTGKMLPRIWMS